MITEMVAVRSRVIRSVSAAPPSASYTSPLMDPGCAAISGPDKSSTVTEVVAPEEPKVEAPEEGEEGEFEPTEPPDFDDEPIDIPEVPVEE